MLQSMKICYKSILIIINLIHGLNIIRANFIIPNMLRDTLLNISSNLENKLNSKLWSKYLDKKLQIVQMNYKRLKPNILSILGFYSKYLAVKLFPKIDSTCSPEESKHFDVVQLKIFGMICASSESKQELGRLGKYAEHS